MEDELQSMVGLAHGIVKSRLRRKDPVFARWFLEHHARTSGTRLLTPLVSATRSMPDVETVSREAMLAAIRGIMTFEELKAVQDALMRHTVLNQMIDLRSLRRELDGVMETMGSSTTSVDHMPAWGRLKEVTAAPPLEIASYATVEGIADLDVAPKPRRRKSATPKVEAPPARPQSSDGGIHED